MKQNLSMFIRNVFALIILGAFSLGVVTNVDAADDTPHDTMPSSQDAVTVATVNVQDLQLLHQDHQVFSLYFTLSNGVGIQTNILYAVRLLELDAAGQWNVVDTQVYRDDVIQLGSHETLQKNIVYTAPQFLKGNYLIEIEASTSQGLSLGTQRLETEILLDGNDEYLEYATSSCSLTHSLSDNRSHSVDQSLLIAHDSAVTAHCSFKNISGSEMKVIPHVSIYDESYFGALLQTEKSDEITIPSKQNQNIEITLPKVTKPQGYAGIIDFYDEHDVKVAKSLAVFFMVQGDMAKILNMTADKDIYVVGDTAKINVYWVGMPHSYFTAMADDESPSDVVYDNTDTEENIESFQLQVTMMNGKHIPCSTQYMKTLPMNALGGVESIRMPVTSMCTQPSVQVEIRNADDAVLTDASYDITSKSVPIETSVLSYSDGSSLKKYCIVAISMASLLLLLWYLLKKNTAFKVVKKSKMRISFWIYIIVMTASCVISTQVVSADTFSLDIVPLYPGGKGAGWYVQRTVPVNFTVNSNKSTYATGEAMTITNTTHFVYNTPSPGTASATFKAQNVNVNATVSGVKKNIINTVSPNTPATITGSSTFMAPNTPGSCNAKIQASILNTSMYYNSGFKGLSIWYPAKTVTLSSCSVYIPNVAPIAPSIVSMNGIYSIQQSQSLNMGITGHDGDGDAVFTQVYWGDGTQESVPGWLNFVANNTQISRSHVWSKPGTYTITALSYDGKVWGAKGYKTITVTAPTPQPPTLSLTGNGAATSSSIILGSKVLLSWTGSNIAPNSCSFAGGLTESGVTVGSVAQTRSVTPSILGSVTYTLSCIGINGISISRTVVIAVNAAAVNTPLCTCDPATALNYCTTETFDSTNLPVGCEKQQCIGTKITGCGSGYVEVAPTN